MIAPGELPKLSFCKYANAFKSIGTYFRDIVLTLDCTMADVRGCSSGGEQINVLQIHVAILV